MGTVAVIAVSTSSRGGMSYLSKSKRMLEWYVQLGNLLSSNFVQAFLGPLPCPMDDGGKGKKVTRHREKETKVTFLFLEDFV